MNRPTPGRRWPLAVAILLGAVSALAGWAEFTPLAVPFETRPTALGAGVAALAVLAWTARRQNSRWRRAAWVLSAALALGATALAARLVFWTYRQEEVRFANGAVTLAGTLYLPRTAAPHPAIVFLHGSGSDPRTEHRYLGKLFARHGFAALTYDKRGAGASSGETYGTDYAGYAADALAALRLLAARPDVDPRRIGLGGHSEGGWVALLVAEAFPDLAFLIVISSTPLSPAEQVIYETGARVSRAGFGEATVARALELRRREMHYDRTGGDRELLQAELDRVAEEPWFPASELSLRLGPIESYPWWRSVMDFDPVPRWRKVRCPVLAVNGGRDLMSDASSAQQQIRQALAEGGNSRFTGRIFPNMEHGTIEWRLPGRIPPPVFPRGYRELLIGWAREQVRAEGGVR